MKRYILILAALVFCASPPLAGDLAGASAAAASIGVGDDGFRVPGGPNNVFDLGSSPLPAIPADFFGPGSDPFSDTLLVEGATGGIDTVVSRLTSTVDLDPLPYPNTATIDIEIVELNLKSISPITVTFNGGQNPELWDMEVDLSALTPPPPLGHMLIDKEHPNGGTFDAVFSVQPRFTFTKVGNPIPIFVLDTGLEGLPPLEYWLMDPLPAPWSTVSPFPFPVPPNGDFFPGVAGGVPQPLVFDAGGGNRLELVLHAVPEPSALVLLSMAAVALLGYVWRGRRRR